MVAAFPSHTRVPGTTEWGAQVAYEPAVEPNHAGVDSRGNAVGPLQVPGPDRSRQAVFGGIHEAQGFLFVGEGLQGRDRPENLLPVRDAVVPEPFDERGLHEEAALEARLAGLVATTTTEDAATLSSGRINGGEDLVAVCAGDHRPHAGGRVHRVTDAELGNLGDHGVPEAVVNRVLHQDAGTAKADLPLIRVRGTDGRGDRLLKIAIVEHDGGVLSPEFEGELLELR